MRELNNANDSWEYTNLGEIAKISSGATPSRAISKYWNGSILWITTGEINYNEISQSNEKITQEALEATSLKLYSPGTILLAMIGQGATRGRVAQLKVYATINQNCCAIVPSQGILSQFLYYYLESKYHEIRNMSNAGGQQNLNSGLIRNIAIPFTPVIEQQYIINILSTWDHAIDLITQLIAAKQQRKRGLMQQLLTGKKRFQEYTNTPWQSLRAGDIFQPHSKRNNGDEELLSVTQDRGVIPRCMLETRVVMPAGETASYKLVEVGDFIISLRSFQGGIEYFRASRAGKSRLHSA